MPAQCCMITNMRGPRGTTADICQMRDGKKEVGAVPVVDGIVQVGRLKTIPCPACREGNSVRKENVQLIDDVDGGPAAETVEFALDGVEHSLDLKAKNARLLRQQMKMWIDAADKKKKADKAARGQARKTQQVVARPKLKVVKTSVPMTPAANAQIRAWAKRKKIAVGSRGRIPGPVRAAFIADQRNKVVK